MININKLKAGDYIVATKTAIIGTVPYFECRKNQWLAVTKIYIMRNTVDVLSYSDNSPAAHVHLDNRFRLPYKNEVMK